jgi:NADH dehydrogenase FAD-containing subunit
LAPDICAVAGADIGAASRCLQVTQDIIKLKGGEEISYGVCVWSAGNAPRPLVQQLAEQIPEQAEFQPGGRPSKLAVDPFLRVIGAKDVLAIGDNSLVVGDRLPTTAQVNRYTLYSMRSNAALAALTCQASSQLSLTPMPLSFC